jgi:hypothetical protein
VKRQSRIERNQQAEARLLRTAPAGFPRAPLVHAVRQTWVPPLPRLAVASYWAAHPVRADRMARALAARTGAPAGWSWGEAESKSPLRTPPVPFREAAFDRGPGSCCICGQPVFRFGWHRDLWQTGSPNLRARWHAACVVAWRVWTAPGDHIRLMGRFQKRRCALSGDRLLKTAEADHRMPLHQVWRRRGAVGWPDLLAFWGFPNLQAVNPEAHRLKSAAEAGHRAVLRRGTAERLGALP